MLGSGSGPGVGGRAVGVSAIGCLLCGSEIGVWTLLRIHRGRWIAAIESQKILPRSAAWRWRNPGSVTSSQYTYIYIHIYMYIYICIYMCVCVSIFFARRKLIVTGLVEGKV